MNLKIFNKNSFLYLIIIIFIFLIDRLSKFYVIFLNENNTSEIFSSKFLNIELYWNTGIAFGLFSFAEANVYNLFTLLITFVIIIILRMLIKTKDFRKYPLLMIFSGAIGNLYDRIFYKAVPDFIDLHIEDFHWFIFNVADIFITIGVIYMILLEIIGNKKNYEKA